MSKTELGRTRLSYVKANINLRCFRIFCLLQGADAESFECCKNPPQHFFNLLVPPHKYLKKKNSLSNLQKKGQMNQKMGTEGEETI